jgi:hypothetical protein
MCQPGHLTRPLEPYARELFEGCCERAARINRCPGGVYTVPAASIANITICAQLNGLSAK